MTTLDEDLMRNAAAAGTFAKIRGALFNPGFSVVLRYRLARRLRQRRGWSGGLLGRIAWLSNVRAFGCYIAPTARIGPGLMLPHPVGIVIGIDVVIGRNATIYQHVTLGLRGIDQPGCPVLGDNVTVYAGAVIIGAITIGDGAVIGANAVVTHDVPAGAIATGIPARIRPGS